DDAFSTIVAAVEQGRVIFANIRASVTFMLCTNVAEVLAVAIPTLIGWTLPLHPLQILYLNVITDVFPALALGVGPGSGQEMRQPPRPADEPVLTSAHWRSIAGWAGLLAACVLAALLLAENWLQLDTNAAVTVSFLTLAFGKLWFTFNLRQPGSNFLKNGITANPWVWGALALCIGLLLLSVYLPGLNTVLKTSDPGGSGWILLLSISLIPVLVGQIRRSLQRPPEVGD
ncbi:MAG: cation transporting ATPase C-terminal domain-containing protein, partial [Planctomycetota bacterium]